MTTAVTLAAVLYAGSAAPNAAPFPRKEVAVSVQKDEESIRKTLKAFAEAVSCQDYAAVLDMITDDAIFWTANYLAIEGKAALKAAYEGLAAYKVHQEFEVEELQVCGDWAFVRGYESFTLDPKDGRGERVEIKRRRAISIFRRQPDGSWKTARGMTNYDAPPPSASKQ